MKASHRKDVIIARLIFAAICIFIIAGITAIVVTITSKHSKKNNTADAPQNVASESETSADTEIGTIYLPQSTTENTEESVTYVTTTNSVNMREKPDKNATIITVISPNVKLEYLSEDNGWTEVKFQDQTGYVSSDYVKSSLQDSTSGDGAANDGTSNDGTTDSGNTDNNTTKSDAAGSVTAGVSSALMMLQGRM